MSKEERIASLKTVSQEIELMPNEDVERVVKLAKAVLKNRTALQDLVEEVGAEI